MIVYSERTRRADPRALLEELRAGLFAGGEPDEALLIAAGVLEAGVTDALSPEEDDEPEAARPFARVTRELAQARRGDGAAQARALAAVDEAARGPLPRVVEVTEPEGFAFYALMPELHAEAARRFAVAVRPARATVVGLRSIGTTLAAVVAAELVAAGVAVRVVTVRPRGHPFERELRLGSRLRAALEQADHVLIVDEGPGISGSSFAAAAEAALRAGVPEGRIALFPSWDSDGTGLRSERARALWPRLSRWVVGFEEAFVDTGRLAAPWGGGALRDLSGGLWRELIPERERPAVQPQHERRKYRLAREDGPLLLKFAGLGERGRRMLARAEAQAAAGLAPEPVGLADGFLALRFVEGRLVGALDDATMGAVGRHLAWVARQAPVGQVRAGELLELTRTNVAEGLGEGVAERLGWMEAQAGVVEARPAVAVDGRMLPQEWLRTGRGVLKTDGLDHHDDHFWPGTQDIAWDLAGAMTEFGMDAEARERLVGDYIAATGDRGVREVLAFQETAYLAWRLGYASLAAETLGDGPDGRGMARARDGYAAALRAAIERGAA
ncbi:hypothetical protein [Rubellimicrobium aerolatum]|uniref:Uncharacterized protein n=1 Tax=Rubellimicrobium aerolatum TaxID=490979 RepID=A0ABW0SFQ1_9RHOB|nr:hypothetical protein [Rubellimicrobium aerolatum]MBP1806405.1 hypothetical protein [Rubellimicrobium aerolatum]